MTAKSKVFAFGAQLALGLKLQFRNRLALFYGYLFPTIFLLAFWALYRHESVPLARHLGEILTVTALGGACFGLPTSLVAERERGLWRRYRLAPISTAHLLATTLLARYVVLLSAALLQIVLAMGVFGMPAPAHPADLWLAFTIVAAAFMGLGLVIAAMADTVPAVQALGQVVFLPMLIIGGIAVPIGTLPEWAQLLAAYFPGRYAVETIQTAATGDGVRATVAGVAALIVIGAAAALAGAKSFRWDAGQRFSFRQGGRWLAIALVAWVFVGTAATSARLQERRDIVAASGSTSLVELPPLDGDLASDAPAVASTRDPAQSSAPVSDAADALGTQAAADADTAQPQNQGHDLGVDSPGESAATAELDSATIVAGGPAGPAVPPANDGPDAPATDAQAGTSTEHLAAAEDAGMAAESPSPNDDPAPAGATQPWRSLTDEDIRAPHLFTGLPPDDGIVAPIAQHYAPYPEAECLRRNLPAWEPASVEDPVQRVRNLLYVAAVPDVLRFDEIEATIPLVVFDRLRQDHPEEELSRILYWIATNPYDGDHAAAFELDGMCLSIPWVDDIVEIRVRTAMYAVKLLGRLTGRL